MLRLPRLLALILLPLTALGTSACNDEVGCGSLGCGAQTGLEFEYAPDCSDAEMTGDLEIAAGNGDGEGGFKALAPDQVPDIHHGPQGGTHMWTGLQIRNPNLARPLHRISFKLQQCTPRVEDCALEESWTWDGMPEDEDEHLHWTAVDVESGYLHETAQGWLEIRDVLKYLTDDGEVSPDTQLRLVVGAEDSCGRIGRAVYLDERGS